MEDKELEYMASHLTDFEQKFRNKFEELCEFCDMHSEVSPELLQELQILCNAMFVDLYFWKFSKELIRNRIQQILCTCRVGEGFFMIDLDQIITNCWKDKIYSSIRRNSK